MKVREILAIKGTALFTITPNRFLSDAVAVMVEQDIGSLVVFDAGKMVGLLTFREVLVAVHHACASWGMLTVEEAMLRQPIVADPDMELDALRLRMVQTRQRYFPVMEEGTLLGVVSFYDVAKAVLEEKDFENRMLKDYIRNWPETGEKEV
ncbi:MULTISPECIES: CBS domain-containing protein [Tepidiphilus]|uniref:CBS domain-containing protein n=1 Tax=Tepidiphilus baoligensis TaxID=2698687 RepID=A0ABX1QKE5_9PROT|nr:MULTISPECIES: CBS domain-containing protein [Tepidiphilus]NMH15795.1 CBS domain-containing protein [Tepidiphilus baoligensis]